MNAHHGIFVVNAPLQKLKINWLGKHISQTIYWGTIIFRGRKSSQLHSSPMVDYWRAHKQCGQLHYSACIFLSTKVHARSALCMFKYKGQHNNNVSARARRPQEPWCAVNPRSRLIVCFFFQLTQCCTLNNLLRSYPLRATLTCHVRSARYCWLKHGVHATQPSWWPLSQLE